MMTSVKAMQSSLNQSSWTIDQFGAGSTFSQSFYQSTPENGSQQMPESKYNQSNWTNPVEPLTHISSCYFCYFIFNGIVVLMLCVAGFLTNLLTILGLRRDPENENATIWLLKTLAAVDNVYLSLVCVVLPMEAIAFFINTTVMWTVDFFVSVILQPLISVVHCLTVWIVVLVTVARYLCIVRPMDIKWRSGQFAAHESGSHLATNYSYSIEYTNYPANIYEIIFL